MTDPRTEAGRAFLDDPDDGDWFTTTLDNLLGQPSRRAQAIAAIETEAVTAALERLRAVVEGRQERFRAAGNVAAAEAMSSVFAAIDEEKRNA